MTVTTAYTYSIVQSRTSGERFAMRETATVAEIGEVLYHGDVAEVAADIAEYFANTTDEISVVSDAQYADFRLVEDDELTS